MKINKIQDQSIKMKTQVLFSPHLKFLDIGCSTEFNNVEHNRTLYLPRAGSEQVIDIRQAVT